MKKISGRFISIVMLSITSLLLIITMYSWYVVNKTATVFNIRATTEEVKADLVITFNTGDDTVDVPVVPGSFSAFELTVSSSKTTYARANFRTPVVKWKDITTSYTALESKEDFEPGVYYNEEHELLMVEPDDFSDNYSSYYTVSDSVVTVLKTEDDEVESNMDFSRLYGVNEYYTSDDEGETFTKTLLTQGEKREEFLKLWKNDDVKIYESLMVYVSDEKIDAKDYLTTLAPLYEAGDFEKISDSTVEFDSISEEGQTLYFYFYYDPSDLYFNTSENIYFYGQNPYFLQSISLNLFIA